MSLFKPRKVSYHKLSSSDVSLASSSKNAKSGPYKHLLATVLALGWAITLILYWHLSISTRKPLTPIPLGVFWPITKVFEHNEWWSGMSAETQDHWNAQFAGHGALWVEHPEKYGLENGIVAEFDHPHKDEIDEPQFFIISKLHEVHCLSWIRRHWWTALTGGNLTELEDGGVFPVHIDHCFEYLRQALSCGGEDIVFEGYSPLMHEGRVSTAVSGWGRAHRCIDFDALADFQTQQEARYNLTWQRIDQ